MSANITPSLHFAVNTWFLDLRSSAKVEHGRPNIQGDGRQILGHFLNAILGHKYYQNHSNRVTPSEWSQHLQQKWLITVCKWVSPQYTIRRLFCRRQHSGSVHGYSETRSRSNVWKEHTHKYDKTHYLLQILGLFAPVDPVWMILTRFWPKMAYKISPRNFWPSPWILSEMKSWMALGTSGKSTSVEAKIYIHYRVSLKVPAYSSQTPAYIYR